MKPNVKLSLRTEQTDRQQHKLSGRGLEDDHTPERVVNSTDTHTTPDCDWMAGVHLNRPIRPQLAHIIRHHKHHGKVRRAAADASSGV